MRLLEETVKVLGGNSKPPLAEPDYLYSWAKVGERASVNLNGNNFYASNNNNTAFAQQLAAHRHSPGANTAFAGAFVASSSQLNMVGTNANMAEGKVGKNGRPLSLRGSSSASPAPNVVNSVGGLNNNNNNAVVAGTPPKASSGFMVSV